MVKTAVALLRKIWREICRQIFRESGTLTLPVPAHPRGQLSGAVPGMFVSPPEPQRALLEELTENVVSRLPDMDCRERGARVIWKATGPYIGDLPASADQHHSEAYGLLRHSLEVALKMLEEFEKMLFRRRASKRVRYQDSGRISAIAVPVLLPKSTNSLRGLVPRTSPSHKREAWPQGIRRAWFAQT
jgi:Putative helicase